MKDRSRIKADYVERGMSLEEVSAVWGLGMTALQRRAAAEDWQGQRMDFLRRDNAERIEMLSIKLLESIEQRLDEKCGIELKDYKAVSGALKELKEMHRGEEQRPSPEKREEGLRVRFVGEAEDCSV